MGVGDKATKIFDDGQNGTNLKFDYKTQNVIVMDSALPPPPQLMKLILPAGDSSYSSMICSILFKGVLLGGLLVTHFSCTFLFTPEKCPYLKVFVLVQCCR